MDWINCNMCCRQPCDERERLFMISSCGHIICDICLSQAESRDKCRFCSEQCQLVQLSSEMKPEVGMFFQEPLDLFKKHHMQMKRLLEFQRNHRTRLVSYHRKMILRMKELEKQYRLATERIQVLEKENLKLKELLNTGSGSGTDYGIVVSSSNPHESYQRAISASALRNSPQGPQPNNMSAGFRHLSGRIALMRGKAGSPANRNSPNMQIDDRMRGKQPIHPTMARGGGFPYQVSPGPNDIGTPMYMSPDLPGISSAFSRNVVAGGRNDRQESPLVHQVGSQGFPYTQSQKGAPPPFQMQEGFGYKARSPALLFPRHEGTGGQRNFNPGMKPYPRY